MRPWNECLMFIWYETLTCKLDLSTANIKTWPKNLNLIAFILKEVSSLLIAYSFREHSQQKSRIKINIKITVMKNRVKTICSQNKTAWGTK